MKKKIPRKFPIGIIHKEDSAKQKTQAEVVPNEMQSSQPKSKKQAAAPKELPIENTKPKKESPIKIEMESPIEIKKEAQIETMDDASAEPSYSEEEISRDSDALKAAAAEKQADSGEKCMDSVETESRADSGEKQEDAGETAAELEEELKKLDEPGAVSQKELYVPVPFTQKRPQIPFDPSRAIEAALFMSSRPLKREEIAKLIGTGSLGSVDTAVSALQKEYSERKSAIEISSENGIYSMRLKQDYVSQTKQFSTEAEISRHGLKTLALISKNEGITKRKLFGMLGSSIYSDCAELGEAGFISHRKAGRTSSLHTTPKFRDYFGGQ